MTALQPATTFPNELKAHSNEGKVPLKVPFSEKKLPHCTYNLWHNGDVTEKKAGEM